MRLPPLVPLSALAAVAFAAAALAGCRSEDTPTVTEATVIATALDTTDDTSGDPFLDRTLVYVCDGGGTRFVVRVEGDAAFLYPAEQQLPLRLARLDGDSAAVRTGTYGRGRDRLVLLGDSARLDAAGKRYRDCHSDPGEALWENARLSGVDFRAFGHTPGWNLDIHDDSLLVFVADSGRTRLTFPAPTPDVDARALRGDYRATSLSGRRLAATLNGRACVDAHDGTRFETTVAVRLDSIEYIGCGRSVR